MTHQEIRTIEHKGVKVSFKIDYDLGEATLVEKNDGTWVNKKYIFAGRGLEYMQGWIDVLEAMQVAVNVCKESLEESYKENRIQKEQEAIARASILADANKYKCMYDRGNSAFMEEAIASVGLAVEPPKSGAGGVDGSKLSK